MSENARTRRPLRVGVLGLGAMGSRFVRRLRDAGFDVYVWNRTPARAARLAPTGARPCPSPRAVAESSDVVLMMLWDSPALDAVVHGPDGVLAGLQPGAVVVDASTVEPEASAAVAQEVRAAGGDMLDTPVSGSLDAAEAGRLLIMVGGPSAALERARPVLDVLGDRVVHVGERNGSGLALKLAVNMQVAAQAVAWGEALTLVEGYGIGRDRATEVMLGSVVASPMLHYRAPFVLEPPAEVWASADQLRKDVVYAVARTPETAASARHALALLERLCAEGRGDREAAELMVAAAERRIDTADEPVPGVSGR
ncbi:hypothetical protein BJF90_13485 [Pseudonocardia sp. CNS-004]|nr:hypothetical protein BJF90_13485 [Pseudonocardia sp. CNS-004]